MHSNLYDKSYMRLVRNTRAPGRREPRNTPAQLNAHQRLRALRLRVYDITNSVTIRRLNHLQEVWNYRPIQVRISNEQGAAISRLVDNGITTRQLIDDAIAEGRAESRRIADEQRLAENLVNDMYDSILENELAPVLAEIDTLQRILDSSPPSRSDDAAQ